MTLIQCKSCQSTAMTIEKRDRCSDCEHYVPEYDDDDEEDTGDYDGG